MAGFLGKHRNTNYLGQTSISDGLKLAALSLLVFVLSSCSDNDSKTDTDNEIRENKSSQTSNDKHVENKSDKQEPSKSSLRSSNTDAVATKAKLEEDKNVTTDGTNNHLKQPPNQELNPKSTINGYSAEIVPENMTVQEKKKRFEILVLPAIKVVYSELEIQYEQISNAIGLDIKSQQQIQEIQQLKTIYKVSTDEQLLMAIKPHPKSIALAQAAMESAWGTSRFFREGKNIYGVWSFNKNEARIAASKKRGNKTIWLKKYPTITDAIRDYYKVLAKGRAFVEFRQQKMRANDPYELVKYLDKYSEKGAEYGKELASMIRYNKFEQFD